MPAAWGSSACSSRRSLPDDPAHVSAAAADGDRSADGLLPDEAGGLEGGGAETGWVQDPVGDPGLASGVEGLGSADPFWASECRARAKPRSRRRSSSSGACSVCGWRGRRTSCASCWWGSRGWWSTAWCWRLHGTGGHPLCALGGDRHASLDPVELWLDGALGVWQAGDGTLVLAAAGELPVDEQLACCCCGDRS